LATSIPKEYKEDLKKQDEANEKLEIMSDKMEQFIAITKND